MAPGVFDRVRLESVGAGMRFAVAAGERLGSADRLFYRSFCLRGGVNILVGCGSLGFYCRWLAFFMGFRGMSVGLV